MHILDSRDDCDKVKDIIYLPLQVDKTTQMAHVAGNSIVTKLAQGYIHNAFHHLKR